MLAASLTVLRSKPGFTGNGKRLVTIEWVSWSEQPCHDPATGMTTPRGVTPERASRGVERSARLLNVEHDIQEALLPLVAWGATSNSAFPRSTEQAMTNSVHVPDMLHGPKPAISRM